MLTAMMLVSPLRTLSPAQRLCFLAAERWGNYPLVLAATVGVVAVVLAGLTWMGKEARGAELAGH